LGERTGEGGKKVDIHKFIQGDTKKGTFEKPNKNCRNPKTNFIDRN
jgi:hypothetical protein